MHTAQIIVLPKRSVLDPQGEAVKRSLQHLGLPQASLVRVGKFIEVQLDTKDAEALLPKLNELCLDLLSNPVIEDYTLALVETTATSPKAKQKEVVNAVEPKEGKEKKKKKEAAALPVEKVEKESKLTKLAKKAPVPDPTPKIKQRKEVTDLVALLPKKKTKSSGTK